MNLRTIPLIIALASLGCSGDKSSALPGGIAGDTGGCPEAEPVECEECLEPEECYDPPPDLPEEDPGPECPAPEECPDPDPPRSQIQCMDVTNAQCGLWDIADLVDGECPENYVNACEWWAW